MAKAKSNPFIITQELSMDNTTAVVTNTVDLSAYVDPADRQGVIIDRVDYIFTDADDHLPIAGTNQRITVQVLDAESDALVAPTDQSLVSSCGMTFVSNAPYSTTDLWPDRLGINHEGRIVVNDELQLLGLCSANVADLEVTVRLTCRIATLTNKDFMALALQTVSN